MLKCSTSSIGYVGQSIFQIVEKPDQNVYAFVPKKFQRAVVRFSNVEACDGDCVDAKLLQIGYVST